MRRRDFITLLGGAAAAWPLAARAQQPLPIVAFVNAGDPTPMRSAAFQKGLKEAGYLEGQNVAVEYHWMNGQYDRLPALMTDLVHRRVRVIATPGSTPATRAAKAATTTIPIVFAVAGDPVKLGLVRSFPQPGGNATGISFSAEIGTKRLGLLHELVPKAIRIAVLVNPTNPSIAESTLRDAREAASTLGLQLQVVEARTPGEIGVAFRNLVGEKADALYVGSDSFLITRRVQLSILAARHGLPMAGADRGDVEVGALMSYGTNSADMYHQIGAYSGRILKGTKPAELPVIQSSRFEFVIDISTAQALGLDIPPAMLLRADAVIE
jgi:putative ABC transport system substrate-binding protein